MDATVDYAPGRKADIYGDQPPTVLLWHGSAANNRHVMAPLAKAIAAHSHGVVVPDWSKEADNGGRADLLDSLRFARQQRKEAKADPDKLVVVGWSLGGTAALSLAVNDLDTKVRAVVLLAAPANAHDPITGAPLPDELPATGAIVEVVHGRGDVVVDPADAMEISARLKAAGSSVTLTLLGAGHDTIAMTRHDADRDSYSPCDDEETRVVGESVAAIVARVAARS